jgi:hypothetical protein
MKTVRGYMSRSAQKQEKDMYRELVLREGARVSYQS